MNDFKNKGFIRNNAIWLVVLIALGVFGFLLFKGWDQVINDEIDSMVTVTGNFSCLPLKETSASDTCRLGVRSRDGGFYALDISRIQDVNSDLKADDTIAVTGVVSNDVTDPEWSQYDVVGVILVNTLLRTR